MTNYSRVYASGSDRKMQGWMKHIDAWMPACIKKRDASTVGGQAPLPAPCNGVKPQHAHIVLSHEDQHYNHPILEDVYIVSQILSCLTSHQDRLSASLVCKLWNEALAFTLRHLPIRSRTLLHRLLQRFSHVQELDLCRCCDALQDSDLEEATPFLHVIKYLRIGHPDNPQVKLSDVGLVALAHHCPLLQRIVLSSLPSMSDKAIITTIERCPLLLSVSIENCTSLGDVALEAIARCKCLEEVTLKGHFSFTPQGLQVICSSSLRRVQLEFENLGVEHALNGISLNCKQIQEISVKAKSVDFKGIEFSTLTILRVVVHTWNGVDADIIAIAEANKHLRELKVDINGGAGVSASAVVEVLRTRRALKELHVSGTQMSATLLNSILSSKRLKNLGLLGFENLRQDLARVSRGKIDLKQVSVCFARDMGDMELQLLLQCTSHKLEHLDLWECEGISSIGFSTIGQCVSLHSLNLGCTRVDNDSLRIIAKGVRCLKALILAGCNSISNIEIVAQFSTLKFLVLNECHFVNDKVLSIIAEGCTRLVDLRLSSTKITDRGLYCLIQCGQLQRLDIQNCKRVKAGRGLFAVAEACGWLYHLTISPFSIDSKTLEKLKNRFYILVKVIT